MIGIVFDPSLEKEAFKAAYDLRNSGIGTDIYFDRSYQSQMRIMKKKGYGLCLLFREDGMFAKDMDTGELEPASTDEFTHYLR
jgi:hypothetical protein